MYIAFVFLTFSLNGWSQDTEKQDPKKTTWDKEKDKLKYQRAKDYKGPKDWSSSDPSVIRDDRYVSDEALQRRLYGSSGGSRGFNGSGGSGTIRYQPQQIQRQREKNYQGFDRGGGQGTVKYDPKVKRPDRPKPRLRDRSSSRRKRNARTNSNTSSSSGTPLSSNFWKVLLIIVVVIAVVAVLYLWLRNKKPSDTKIAVDVEDEWNPEVISKTELELKLEAAIDREDYRECIRIYFTFILKELIKKGWIRWKKEKTNHHYVIELAGREGSLSFMECVRIYDLVWYGEYHIDRDIFDMLQPALLNYYKSLDPKDDK